MKEAKPNASRPTHWGRSVLIWCGSLIVVWFFMGGRSWIASGARDDSYHSGYHSPPGWDELQSCEPLRSFDGRKSITFYDDGRAEIWENPSQDETKAVGASQIGRWGYDETSKRYSIEFEEDGSNYYLYSPNSVSICILAKGPVASINLQESWFSLGYEPEDDRPDPRYP
jgi:hypothetical protein